MLARMLTWDVPITKCVLVFRPKRGDLVAHLAYEDTIDLPAMGSRVATLGPILRGKDKLTLRADGVDPPFDLSSWLFELRKMKDTYDGTARRLRYSVGRGNGSARTLRRKFVDYGKYAKYAKQQCHVASKRIIGWCQSAGVGKLVVLSITDQDWPAYDLVQKLTYKGAAVNITVVDESGASLADASTDRAVTAPIKTAQRKAKRVREAVRTLTHEYEETTR